jgi:hypothetical protein
MSGKKGKSGGARLGAGRPAGRTKVLMNFTLSPEIVECLRRKIPAYRRSSFVAATLSEALKDPPLIWTLSH